MRITTSNAVLTASSLLLWAPFHVAADINYNTTQYVDCYSQVPNFVNNGTWTYQSTGYCQHQCVPMGYSVMALIDGKDCWCGNELPPNSTKTDSCNTPCDGYNLDTCGGSNAYDVYLTGMTSSVAVMSEGSATTSASITTTAGGVTYVTQAGTTIVITASSDPSASAKSSSSSSSGGSSNTAGIAAGVVVGVVALSAIIGAAIFFWRRQQKKRVEEEYRRNAEINSFAQKPASMSSDPRWDGDFMAQRRQSNGSIADDQDFSRRILQVTNPDGH